MEGLISFLHIIQFICGIIFIVAIYFLIRNERVYSLRTRLLYNDYDSYIKLPEYNKMLYSIKPLIKRYWVK